MLSSREPLEAPLLDERAEELRRLEQLWEAPAAPEPALARRRRLGARLVQAAPPLGWSLAAAWVAFLASIFALTPPASQPVESEPLWVQALVLGLWLALPAAALGAILRSSWLGYGAALSAGGIAVALSIACTTTGHHTGSWWAYELGGSLAVTGLAAAGLERARRGSGR